MSKPKMKKEKLIGIKVPTKFEAAALTYTKLKELNTALNEALWSDIAVVARGRLFGTKLKKLRMEDRRNFKAGAGILLGAVYEMLLSDRKKLKQCIEHFLFAVVSTEKPDWLSEKQRVERRISVRRVREDINMLELVSAALYAMSLIHFPDDDPSGTLFKKESNTKAA